MHVDYLANYTQSEIFKGDVDFATLFAQNRAGFGILRKWPGDYPLATLVRSQFFRGSRKINGISFDNEGYVLSAPDNAPAVRSRGGGNARRGGGRGRGGARSTYQPPRMQQQERQQQQAQPRIINEVLVQRQSTENPNLKHMEEMMEKWMARQPKQQRQKPQQKNPRARSLDKLLPNSSESVLITYETAGRFRFKKEYLTERFEHVDFKHFPSTVRALIESMVFLGTYVKEGNQSAVMCITYPIDKAMIPDLNAETLHLYKAVAAMHGAVTATYTDLLEEKVTNETEKVEVEKSAEPEQDKPPPVEGGETKVPD
jgi:hypothetical protein